MIYYFIFKFLHLLLISLWVGGQLALPFIILPAVKNIKYKNALLVKIGLQFAKIGHYILLLILVSGILTYYFKGFNFSTSALFSGYGKLFLTKIAFFLLMVIFTIFHEWHTIKNIRENRVSPEFGNSKISGYLVLLISIFLMALGIMLHNGLWFF